MVRSHFPAYTNMQVAQRVRVTADDLYSTWPGAYVNKMGRGRVNAYRALTETTPGVRVLNVEFSDRDGNDKIQPGDTVDIYAEFINYLDPVTNLTVSLTTPSSSVTVLSSGSAYWVGNLATMGTSGTCLAPFTVVISPLASADSRVYFKFNYDGDTYDDQEYWEKRVNTSYIDLGANNVITSMNSRGNFGYTDFPSSPKGQGFKFEGDLNYLGEGGFMIGTSATRVSDVVRNGGANQDADFQNLQPVYKLEPGPFGDEEGHAVFNDNPAGANSLGVTVRKHAYQFAEAPDDDYIIFEYVITNDGSSALTDAYAGVYADWDVGWWVVNHSQYWAGDRMVTVFDDVVGTPFYYSGMSLITPDSMHAYAAHEGSWGYSTADKWHALTQPPDSAESDTADIIQTISAGPFTIAPGDSHIVAFALFGGTTIPEMQTTAAAAAKKYNCFIRGGTLPAVALGADILDCDGPSTYTLDAGAGYASYLWNTGATSQTITADSTGIYHVRVSDGNGCFDWDEIELIMDNGVTAGMTVSATNILRGDSILFEDNSTGATKFYWDFGDGSAGSIQPDFEHTYLTSGSFTAMHIVSNGTCKDTLFESIQVDTLTSRDPLLENTSIKVYPNPAKDLLTLDLSTPFTGKVSFSLHTLLGKKVRAITRTKTAYAHREKLDLSQLSPGVYIGRIQFGEQIKSFKIVVE